jgi:hypothetical protein
VDPGLAWDERRASAWLPVLQALEASACPEVADAWVEYGRRLQGPKRNAKRALAALWHALDLHLAASDVTRMAVDEAVRWVSTTCENANLPDELIEVYRAFGWRRVRRVRSAVPIRLIAYPAWTRQSRKHALNGFFGPGWLQQPLPGPARGSEAQG